MHGETISDDASYEDLYGIYVYIYFCGNRAIEVNRVIILQQSPYLISRTRHCRRKNCLMLAVYVCVEEKTQSISPMPSSQSAQSTSTCMYRSTA